MQVPQNTRQTAGAQAERVWMPVMAATATMLTTIAAAPHRNASNENRRSYCNSVKTMCAGKRQATQQYDCTKKSFTRPGSGL